MLRKTKARQLNWLSGFHLSPSGRRDLNPRPLTAFGSGAKHKPTRRCVPWEERASAPNFLGDDVALCRKKLHLRLHHRPSFATNATTAKYGLNAPLNCQRRLKTEHITG